MSLIKIVVELFYWFMVFRAFILIIDFTRGYDIEIPYRIVVDEEKERET